MNGVKQVINAAWLAAIAAAGMGANVACGATMFSVHDGFMGAGIFYGPGKVKDVPIFDVVIQHIGFSSELNYVTPFFNNGGSQPNICGERQIRATPTGFLSDGVTKINENVDACAFQLDNAKVLVAIIDGGPHQGEQIAVTLNEHGEPTMVMTMDFAIDLGVGKAGVIRVPFYGTTGEVTIPNSLQTQMGIPGGIDAAGTLKPGDKIRGRLGDFNHDGLLDGAIVVAGNIPLDSIFMPGAPYALIRYFETDIPADGLRIGKLPGTRPEKGKEPPPLRAFLPGKSNATAQAQYPAVPVQVGRKE
jgi:hypothetical protein